MKIFGEGKKELFAYFAYFAYFIYLILHILHVLYILHVLHILDKQTPVVISFPKTYHIISLSVVLVFVFVFIFVFVFVSVFLKTLPAAYHNSNPFVKLKA